MPTRFQQFEAEQVDVLVGARGAIHRGGRGGEFGRIKNDEVKGAAGVAQFALGTEDVGFAPFVASGLKTIGFHVLARDVECRAGGVNREDLAGAAPQ